MDDLYKDAADAWSFTIREKVQDWYDTVLRTRLHNNSQQLLVFTRWHEEDLAGYLLRTEPENWEVVLFEAIKERPHDYDPREIGEPLWGSQHSLENLQKIKKNNPIVFDSLYQQNPTPREGLLIPEAEIKRFNLSDLQYRPDGVVSTIDIADSGEDNLCQVVAYRYGDDVYIVDVVFSQDPIEITQPLVAQMLDKEQVDVAYFESNNGGKGYAQKVKEIKEGKTTIKWQATVQNKHTRIIMKSGIIKEHFYFRKDIDNHPEYKKYLYELTHYAKNGKSKHDDAIDATTMMAERLFTNKSKWGF
jgi:predicted phage terminase large subunit-like protein